MKDDNSHPIIVSAPHLYAIAHGQDCTGPHRCYYCTAPCDERFPISEYVKDSFTGRDGVPACSQWICVGCTLCLRERCDLTTADGNKRTGMKVRGFSWVITPAAAQAATKADLNFLRLNCLVPPESPFVICLSDSGQKHLLYRGVVNHSRSRVVATLEGERIEYTPDDLGRRLGLCQMLCAVTGKPALREPPSTQMGMNFIRDYPTAEDQFDLWLRVWNEPLSRLASWICPNRDDCQKLFMKDED